MNLRSFTSLSDLVTAAARAIVQRVRPEGRTVIALSGGSTPKPLYELLGQSPWREQLEAAEITWVVVDERHVPRDDPQFNAAMIERTLFAQGLPPSHRFLFFDTAEGDAEATAAGFERRWRELAIEQLDVILLGCGDDGHTASLFPGTPVLEVDDRVAAAVYVPRLEQWRVTLTLPVIRAAGVRYVLAAGEKKRAIIEEIRAGADYPVVRATGGDIETWWLVAD
ncbi:MAG TPA: 6-phosphogluconolactonase [Thermoanaerobaculia bacterium]